MTFLGRGLDPLKCPDLDSTNVDSLAIDTSKVDIPANMDGPKVDGQNVDRIFGDVLVLLGDAQFLRWLLQP